MNNKLEENKNIKETDEYWFYVEDVVNFYKKEITWNLMKDWVGFIWNNADDKKTLYWWAARATTYKQKNIIKEEIFDYSKKYNKEILAQKLNTKSWKNKYLKQLEKSKIITTNKALVNKMELARKSYSKKEENNVEKKEIKKWFISKVWNIFKKLNFINNSNYKKKKSA